MSLSRQRAQPAQCSIVTAMLGRTGAVPRPSRPRQTPPDRAERGWSTAPTPATYPGAFIPNRRYIFSPSLNIIQI